MSLLKEIENRRHTLSRAEEQVATWLLANARESAHLAIAEVAARAGVSEPTVIRFCRTLGMSGFRDFRAQLIRSLHEPETYLHRDVTAADSARDATGKVLDSCIRALVEAMRCRAVETGRPPRGSCSFAGSARRVTSPATPTTSSSGWDCPAPPRRTRRRSCNRRPSRPPRTCSSPSPIPVAGPRW